MSDANRLAELQRQRALAQQQLAWIESEIARETPRLDESARLEQPAIQLAPVASPSVSAVSPSIEESTANDATESAEKILSRYRQAPATSAQATKRGCFIYFYSALGALVVFCGILYFIYAKWR
ncbi:hypothetical protein [Oleiharenicola lentus]|uniref:hypothetical protein n=1 Tax=Oleiharenicola lentus TaxID=2508720 RepID=UPI003F66CFD7